MISVKLEFSGGLELLLRDTKTPSLTVSIASGSKLRALVCLVREQHIKERHELFSTPQGDV
jgi:hypothetical protein